MKHHTLNKITYISTFVLYLLSQSAYAKVMNQKINNNTSLEKATVAGGCFWCMEPPFEKLRGVKSVVSGYSGGTLKNPTYKQVSSGKTQHLEVIQITFDPKIVSYKKILDVYWQQVDPTDSGGQFVDRGRQYATAIYYHSEAQKKVALTSKQKLSESGRYQKPIVTPIQPFVAFYAAEDYHQDYYRKNPIRYKYYRYRSGRDQYLKSKWGKQEKRTTASQYRKPSDEELRKTLTPLQYQVTQKDGTEKPFDNKYWDNKKAGIYVDIVSGEPLFSSTHKYKSGTGWPSFWQPLATQNIVEKKDKSLFLGVRTEVRSAQGDSHLGHVFDDGPKPTGKRYCINSASLRFVPKEDLKQEGYEKYLPLFE